MVLTNTLGRLCSVQASDSTGNPLNNLYSYDYRGATLLNVDSRQRDPNPMPITPTGYSWDSATRLSKTTYPDGLVATLQYPSIGGYSTTLAASGISVPFNGTTVNLVSNANYFANGSIQSLQYGNASTVSVTENKRGEIRFTSGPANAPIVSQTYTYAPNDIGRMTSVTFFLNQQNTWNWTLGYTRNGWLNSYSNNVRVTAGNPAPDSYTWSYDEVGNRTAENYNGALRTYYYDSAGVTNQLQSVSGQSAIGVPAGAASNIAGSGDCL